MNKSAYFIYNKKNIDENLDLFGCIAIILDNGNIQKYKITFENAKDNNAIKEKWPWMFRNKENEIHKWIYELNENEKTLFQKHLNIFNKILDDELTKQIKTTGIPKIFFFNSNDIYNYLKNKNQTEPSIAQIEAFKNWLIIKIALFFNSHPEKTFEFPLYKEFINNNPKILEQDPEYSVESFIIDINEGIANVEELIDINNKG